MVIAKDVPIHKLMLDMIDRNREKGANSNYLDFLIGVHVACCRDKTFAECLEACLQLYTGEFPTIEEVERALARKEGAIRPLLWDKGIIEPSLEGKEG